MEKKYDITNECIGISENHAVFNFFIRDYYDTKKLFIKGNVIINRKLKSDVCVFELKRFVEFVPKDTIQEAINNCIKRAKFIFNE